MTSNLAEQLEARRPYDLQCSTVQLIQRRESVIVSAARAPGFDYEKLARDPRRQ